MQCPACNVPLDSLRVGNIELDECPRCLGLWFDRGELHEVITTRLSSRLARREFPLEPPATDQRLGPCCRCGGSLMAQKSQGPSPAACARCGGFWVPQAAFVALSDAPPPAPQPGGQKARPAPAVALKGRCPACETPMRPDDRQGQGFHRCPQCGGIFLPRGALTFILAHTRAPFEPGPQVPEGVPAHAGCPACRQVMQPISWQGKPVRVWACTQCWGTFAPASALNQLQNPARPQPAGFQGVGGGLWRMLDSVVEWLVSPPKPPQF